MVTAVKRPAGETRGKVAAGPDAGQRHRASPRPYRWFEDWLLIVLVCVFRPYVRFSFGPGCSGCPACRVSTGSDRAGLVLLSR